MENIIDMMKNLDDYPIDLPYSIEFTRQCDMDRLLEKQWRARGYIHIDPFRRALNLRWRAYWNKVAKAQDPPCWNCGLPKYHCICDTL